jgi:hypothetical protein
MEVVVFASIEQLLAEQDEFFKAGSRTIDADFTPLYPELDIAGTKVGWNKASVEQGHGPHLQKCLCPHGFPWWARSIRTPDLLDLVYDPEGDLPFVNVELAIDD